MKDSSEKYLQELKVHLHVKCHNLVTDLSPLLATESQSESSEEAEGELVT